MHRALLLPLLAMVIVGSVGGVIAAEQSASPTPTVTPVPATAPAPLATPPGAPGTASEVNLPAPVTWAPMIKRVAPCVVTVFSSRTVHTQNAMPNWLQDDPMLRRFFGMDPNESESHKQQGLGSGVIVRSDGYILTNNHVVENADELKVGFSDSPDEFPATVVGTDPKTDIAVLHIDPGKRTLPPIQFGNSDKVEVGDMVFAIGNPFGVGQTVTMGIISAIGRDVGLAEYEDFLQTDASINPGNSGGALVDSNGRLVGINTAIMSPTGANLGIGFAVPASLARNVMTSIIEKGKVVRGYLGVRIQSLDQSLAKSLDLPSDQGALVSQVEDGSPAAKAGIHNADVITAINGARIDDARHLRLAIAELPPGSRVSLALERDGTSLAVTATLDDLVESPEKAGHGRNLGAHQAPVHPGGLGIHIDDITDDLRAELRLPEKVEGAVITDVRPGSRAEEAGLKVGMVIIEVERHGVSSADACAEAIERVKGDLLLTLYADGGRLYRAIPKD